MPNMRISKCELSPLNISAASAIPTRSAPMLTELAPKSANAVRISIQRGIFFLSAEPTPSPVTIPIRAQVNCTHPMRGQVRHAVQSRDVPSCAPALEYVAMPEGSSLDAHETMSGPHFKQSRTSD